jgi:DeoR family transcriptional regulator, fructose operon transcriptional repressor
MLKDERLNYILDQVRDKDKVLSSDLSLALQVSEDTIRRDLKELADKGKVRKVHGGAMSVSSNPFSYKEREVYRHESKVYIVQKATELIQNGDVVIMDGGTTNLELARFLPKDLYATIFTNSLPIAILLSEHPSIELVFIGGKILKSAQVSIGIDVIESLQKIHADLCILGTRSIDFQRGITEIDWEETQVKRAIVRHSSRVICLCIQEKLNTSQPYHVCDTRSISTMVTDLDPADPILQPYRRAGIELI